MLDGTKAVCIMSDNARMSPAPHSKPPWPLEHSSSFFYFICVPLRLYVRQKMWMPGSLERAAGAAQVNEIPKPVNIPQGETKSCSKLLCVLRLSHFVPGGRATVVLRTEASTLKLFQKSEREKKTEPLPKHNKTLHQGSRNRFAAIQSLWWEQLGMLPPWQHRSSQLQGWTSAFSQRSFSGCVLQGWPAPV